MAIKGIPLKKADDLFDRSSMSFGAHLEELRKCLFLALAWLAAGMAIGLLFAKDIVTYIQVPLQAALLDYYVRKAENLIELKAGGALDEETKDLMRANNLTAELIYMAPAQLARLQPAGPVADASLNEDKAADADSADAPAGADTGEEPAADREPAAAEPMTLTEQIEAAEGNPPAGIGIDHTPMPNDPDDALQVDPVAAAEALEAAGVGDDPAGVLGMDNPVAVSMLEKFQTPSVKELRPYWQFEKLPANTDALSMQEPFMIWLKAGFVAGLVIASPGIFYSLWKFIAAGLYPHERKYVYTLLPFAVLLFISGVCLAFFVIFELVISFLLTFNESLGISASPRLTDYMSFALFLPLGFGIAFQLPLVMLALERIGLISVQTYISQWRVAILIITVISMILTPAEVTSMLGMGIPLVLLYYVGIALCMYFPRRGFEAEVGYDPK